jgi:hypothetical protein
MQVFVVKHLPLYMNQQKKDKIYVGLKSFVMRRVGFHRLSFLDYKDISHLKFTRQAITWRQEKDKDLPDFASDI